MDSETTLINHDEDDIDQKTEKKKIIKKFALISFGYVLVYSGYTSMLTLQSSVRVQDGLGRFGLECLLGDLNFLSIFYTNQSI